MTRLVRAALARRAITLVLVALFCAAGAVSVQQLRQELFPSLDVPYLVVRAVQPGASPATVSAELARPIEDLLRGADGVRGVSSTSRDGAASVTVEYDYGEDMDARQDELDEQLRALVVPAGATVATDRITTDADVVYSLSVTGDDRGAVDAWVSGVLVPELQGVDGVGAVEVSGSSRREVAVRLDPQRLADAGLTGADVAQAVRSGDVAASVGAVTGDGRTLPVTVSGATGTAAQIERTPVGGTTVGALGTVELADGPVDGTLSRTDGEPSVVVEITKDQTANTVELVEGLRAVVTDDDPPPGVEVQEVLDQAPQVVESVNSLTREALIGVGVLVVVLVLFLRDVRTTVVAGVSVPASLLVTLLLMSSQQITLNLITIGALTIAAARVIDDAVVVTENIHRLNEQGLDRRTAVVEGTVQVVPAITASTLATVSVFLPLALGGGLIGQVFLGFSITIVVALLASLLIAVTVVPVLADLLLRRRTTGPGDPAAPPRPPGRLVRAYAPLLRWALAHRVGTVAAAAAAFALSLTALAVVPTTLFPTSAPTALVVTVDTPAGQDAARTAEVVEPFEALLPDVDGVERYSTVVGDSSDGGPFGGGTDGSARVTATLEEDADADAVAADLESALTRAELTGAVAAAADAGPDSTTLAVDVTGDDFALVQQTAAEVEQAVLDLGEDRVENVASNAVADRPEIAVAVDPVRAEGAGTTAAAVSGAVRTALAEDATTTLTVEGVERTLSVALDPAAVTTAAALADLRLPGDVRLGDVATVEEVSGPSSVTTADGERSAVVSGVITAADTGGVTRELQAALDDIDVPDDVAVSIGGVSETQSDSFAGLLLAMLVAVAAVYLVMTFAFRSLLTPLVILLTLPLAAIGALPALLVAGLPLDISGMIGLLMLIGIVVTNAIVLLDLVERLRREGVPLEQAITEGGHVRLRPILITALTAIGALVPLAVSGSSGALLSAGLATVVIGGLVSSTALTLLVIPAVYSLVERLRRDRPGGPDGPADPAPGGAAPAPGPVATEDRPAPQERSATSAVPAPAPAGDRVPVGASSGTAPLVAPGAAPAATGARRTGPGTAADPDVAPATGPRRGAATVARLAAALARRVEERAARTPR